MERGVHLWIGCENLSHSICALLIHLLTAVENVGHAQLFDGGADWSRACRCIEPIPNSTVMFRLAPGRVSGTASFRRDTRLGRTPSLGDSQR